MSLFLIILILAFMGVAGWGFQSVVAELERSFTQPADAISRKFQVDDFIWSTRAPLALRRRYIATQACAIPACLCLAALVWLNEPRLDVRVWAAVAFCSASLLIGGSLAWKIACRRK
jgi:hypothetical protein